MLGLILGVGLTACGVAESKYGVMTEMDLRIEDCEIQTRLFLEPHWRIQIPPADADGDGYGDANPENDNVEPGTDCNDSDPDVNPENENCE